MAASVIACDKFILLTNGNRFISIPTSVDGAAQCVTIPDEKELDASDSKDESKKQPQPPPTSPNRILTSAVSQDGRLFAVCDDRKFVHLYRQGGDGKTWERWSSRCAARRCTAVRFTKDSSEMLVADKAGDVYSFPVTPAELSTSQTDGDSQPVAQAGATRDLKMGHLSILLDMILVEGDSLVVTCDRDEKVRISNFPQSYSIQAFCLGHTAFVISLAYDSKQKVIMSGSGDCTVRLWTLEGKQLLSHDVTQDLPATTTDSEVLNSEADDKCEETVQTSQQALQQIVFCQVCKLLFVSLYKCPRVLVYQVTSSLLSGLSLSLVESLSTPGPVASLSLHDSTLWILAEDGSGSLSFRLSAHRLDSRSSTLTQINDDVAKVVQKVNSEKEFLEVPADRLDMFAELWKKTCGADGYVEEYRERKRQRIEGNNSHSRFGNQKKPKDVK